MRWTDLFAEDAPDKVPTDNRHFESYALCTCTDCEKRRPKKDVGEVPILDAEGFDLAEDL